MVSHNDWGVDGGADQGVADDVKVRLKRGGRVADRDTPVNQAREISLSSLHCFGESLQLLNLNLFLLLGDGDILQLTTVLLHTAFHHLEELSLIRLDKITGDGSKLSILSNLVGGPGTDRLPIHIHVGLLSQVEPDDGSILWKLGAPGIGSGNFCILSNWSAMAAAFHISGLSGMVVSQEETRPD